MKHKLFVGGLGLSAVLLVPVVLAQRAAPMREPPPRALAAPIGSAYLLNFDPRKMATVEGRVVRLHQVPNTKVWLTSLNALVRTGEGDVNVELGPAWFIDNQELHLAVDDKITVSGSRVKPNGVDTMIATEVKRGTEVLRLRREDGTPVWVAWIGVTPSAVR